MPGGTTNPFQGSGSEPARQFLNIGSGADADLALPIRGLYIGGTGNVTVVDAAGTSIVFSAVPVGTTLPICPKQVRATGTTATLMIGLI